jgi:hypothetical protein
MTFPLATERDKVLGSTSVPGPGYLEGAGGEPKEYKVREPASTKRRKLPSLYMGFLYKGLLFGLLGGELLYSRAGADG